jgi:hypothetical protein
LPHIDVPGAPTFVTWRLWGSLPAEHSFRAEHLSSGAAFVAFDRLLDEARSGPVYLRQPAIATVVMEQLRRVPALHAYVIMPNHVHVLWTPAGSLADLVCQVKGRSACYANKILGHSGQFWQEEYFDRIVRNATEFDRIRRYIEFNPVKAGLVGSPDEYVWSSAWRG